jgi:NADH-quinone oxidoreductase subunit L
VFVTAFYSFRMFFLVFHGQERFHHKPYPPADAGEHDHHDDHAGSHYPHESPWVVTFPLVMLAIPSVLIGALTIGPMLHGDFFKDSIAVDATRHAAMQYLGEHFHGAVAMALHAFGTLVFWLAAAGVAAAWWCYLKQPAIPAALARSFAPVLRLLENKYYMDWINENLIAPAARATGRGLWKGGDIAVIDGVAIDGSAAAVNGFARVVRLLQTGRLYWYALVMLFGVIALLTWRIWPNLAPALAAFWGR